MNDPKLLTRLLQKNGLLPDEDDHISEGKKVLPVDVLSSTYKKFLMPDNSFTVQTISYKGGKGGKEKDGKPRAPEGKTKGRWLPLEAPSYDLLMLPHPDLVNREEETYLLEGPNGIIKAMVTGGNWESLRFSTKSMNPEYFPSSYQKPVPTDPPNKDLSKRVFSNGLSFPRSTITRTLEELRILLCCSPFSKRNKISAETYRALSLNLSTEALDVTDKATAPKRVSAFLRLCATFIPCEHAEYDEAVGKLNAEVSDDLAATKLILEDVQDSIVPAVVELGGTYNSSWRTTGLASSRSTPMPLPRFVLRNSAKMGSPRGSQTSVPLSTRQTTLST
jgi:hypothetical protein